MPDAAGARGITPRSLRLVALAFIAFSVLDWATTCFALSIGEREENPFIAALYARQGPAGFLALRMAIVAAVLIGLCFLPKRVAPWAAMGCTVLTATVVISNVLTMGA